MRSDLFSSDGTSGFTGPFGVEKGSGYEKKTLTQNPNPLTCPRCGAACNGTAEWKKCGSCGFNSTTSADGGSFPPGTTLTEALAANANRCSCGSALTIIGDRRRCNSCGYDSAKDGVTTSR